MLGSFQIHAEEHIGLPAQSLVPGRFHDLGFGNRHNLTVEVRLRLLQIGDPGTAQAGDQNPQVVTVGF